MTVKNANILRAKFVEFFMNYAQKMGEDVGLEGGKHIQFPCRCR